MARDDAGRDPAAAFKQTKKGGLHLPPSARDQEVKVRVDGGRALPPEVHNRIVQLAQEGKGLQGPSDDAPGFWYRECSDTECPIEHHLEVWCNGEHTTQEEILQGTRDPRDHEPRYERDFTMDEHILRHKLR